MVGGTNLTAFPAWSRLFAACVLSQYSWARLAALYGCKIAGPEYAAGRGTTEQSTAATLEFAHSYRLESIAHTIPWLADREETDGIAPGYPKLDNVFEVTLVLNNSVVGL